jgi:ribulose-phosphate 3-epimerase
MCVSARGGTSIRRQPRLCEAHAGIETITGGSASRSKNSCPRHVLDNLDSSLSPSRLAVHWRETAPVIAPSLLQCDFGHLADEVHKLEQADVGLLHLDVMDGHFVPNLSYGLPIVAAVRSATGLPIDVHLMISEPERYAEQFCAAGANLVTFHVEASHDPRALLGKIRAKGCLAGIAFNPDTPISALDACLDACDVVLTMSVQPGFGGQKFEAVALEKLSQLRKLVPDKVLLEVDGGVHLPTIGPCAQAGAQIFVAGSAIFGHDDYSRSVSELSAAARSPGRTQENLWSKSC